MSQELTTFTFEITSLQQAMDYAKMIADSDLAPKDYKGKPGNVLVAIQYGMEIGLKPLQAIQNIAVINGRPAVWGDAMLGLVQDHPLCEYIKEEFKNDIAYCTVKRRGDEEHTTKFSKEDAKKAGLLAKQGVWQQYPERMMQMRARGFALRDKFADVLKGIAIREEVMDYEDNSKQTRKEKATHRVNALIEGKIEEKPNIIIDYIKDMITNSASLEDLEKVTEPCKQLSETDLIPIRTLYSKKKKQLEKSEEKPQEISDFEKIKNQLLNAKSQDTLDLAADLISTCEENLQPELIEIYIQQKETFK